MPHDHEILFDILESKPECLLLGPVLLGIDFIDSFSSGVVDSRDLGCFSDGVSLIVDEFDQLFSLFVRDGLVFLSHGDVSGKSR